MEGLRIFTESVKTWKESFHSKLVMTPRWHHLMPKPALALIWSCVSGHLTNLSPMFTLSAQFFVFPPTFEKNLSRPFS